MISEHFMTSHDTRDLVKDNNLINQIKSVSRSLNSFFFFSEIS